MSGLELTWKGGAGGPPLDASALQPAILEKLTGSHLSGLLLQHGNRRVKLGDLFAIQAKGEAGILVIKAATDCFDGLGKGMSGGAIRVEGDVGDFLAQDLVDGSIEVSGSAGRYLATGMLGGRVRLGGDAGDFLGAALPGSRFGMQGGAVSIGGSIGRRAGDRMRRGLVAVDGDADTYLGARMIGGTFVVGGKAGRHAGLSMRRGTLVLASLAGEPLATFSDGGAHDLPWLHLLTAELAGIGSRQAALALRRTRFTGCAAADGKGEILLA
ncbi:formylmethanofuran dehydrogenase, subunit C [Arboricoccus pini]|uniref:Formylmethanofuran dehydrogenase, subunit C n=1 Tax=Arboricoccus pini TaxID=1963835 RepID=A0A212RZW0_9PROT|nr:formylmethanofuran dehydrogenase subunit C [Arboricoccus pini]SNB78422.1 formylmethanofuran dehydrogenase, subunit C [Arboricoccus pini]